MSCSEILHILGDIASILTIIGFICGLCKWIKLHTADVKIKDCKRDGKWFYLDIYNDGHADAKGIKLHPFKKNYIESNAIVDNLKPGEQSQISFCITKSLNTFTIKLCWKDSICHHTKKHKITPLNTNII